MSHKFRNSESLMPVFPKIPQLLFRAAACACVLSTALIAQNITGTVTNQTNGKAAAGDDVVLIKLAQGMQEADRTRTDAHGHFTLPVSDQGMHLVRVTHDKVPYFHPVPPGTTTADVEVYDSAEKVQGITGEADVMRLQANNSSLEVTELFAIQNDSSPKRTQFGARAFELYLPAQAQITSGAALGPGGMPIQAQPVPLDTPGHYAFVFPIRPGETRFQVAYKLPYDGKFAFSPKLSVPMQNLAVMLPKSMNFTAAPGTAFAPVNDDVNAQVYLVKDAKPTQSLAFNISGTGQMPADNAGNAPAGETANPAGPSNPAEGSAAAASDTRPGGGLGNPIDTPDPLHKYRWWILAAIAVLFVAGIAFAMRKPSAPSDSEAGISYAIPTYATSATRSAPAPAPTASNSTGLLQTLKDELFTLETDRLEGRITEQQYAEVKSALETVLRHALQRNAKVPASV
jgi:hypothetical protein